MKRIIILCLFYFLIFRAYSQITGLTVTGGPIFDTSVLTVTEAGNDFNATITETALNNTKLSIVGGHQGYNDWKIEARLVANVGTTKVEIMRTGDGSTNGGQISGGETWTFLSLLNTEICRGKKGRDDIPFRFRLSNISVINPTGIVPFSVVFTLSSIN